MSREGGSEGEEGEQVQMQLVNCPPMYHWYILQCNEEKR